jgi:hemerythrin-like domain-containing protein
MTNRQKGEAGPTVTEMSPLVGGLLRIHKIISRGISVSIRKCDGYLGKQKIPAEEVTGFSMYVSTLKMITHAHHLSEDEIIYPLFKDKIKAPYDRLTDDHHNISRILISIEQSLSEISSSGVGRLREVLGEFEKLWIPHIQIEEENFTSERILTVIGIKEQAALAEELSKHGMQNAGPGPIALPFMLFNLEVNDRDAFLMNIPWIVKQILVPIIWKGQWKPMKPFLL